MKRPRSVSPDARGASDGDANETVSHGSDARSASMSSSPSSSSLSSRRDSGGEEPDKVPLYTLLDTALTLMKPDETVANTLRRLSDGGATADFDALTATHSACHAQYDVVLMNMKREALVLRATSERAKYGQEPLAPVWFLRWQGNPVVQGPFSAEQLHQWAAGGFFEKRPATLLNGSEVNGRWSDAKTLFPRP